MKTIMEQESLSITDTLTIVKKMMNEANLEDREAFQVAMFFSICNMFTIGRLNVHGIEPYIRKVFAEISLESNGDASIEDLPLHWRIVDFNNGTGKGEVFRWIKVELSSKSGDQSKKVILMARDIYLPHNRTPYQMTPQEQWLFIRRGTEYLIRDKLADFKIFDRIASHFNITLRPRWIKILVG